jgi:transposase
MAARGNVFENVLSYCEEYTFLEKPLASPSASELFASITHEERMAFFKRWVARNLSEKYLAYDVSSFSRYADKIDKAEWGYNRDGDRIPQINLGCFLSEDTGLPIFYVTYPGSIVDKSHLQCMLAYNNELGIEDVCFVLDRGFCSTANIKFLAQQGNDFIMGVPQRSKTTLAAIELARNGIISMRNRVADGVYGTKQDGTFYGTKAEMIVYFSNELAEAQRKDLFRTVESRGRDTCPTQEANLSARLNS